jgi:hypothetical protein
MNHFAAWAYPTGCGTLVQDTCVSYKLLEPYECTKRYAQTGF